MTDGSANKGGTQRNSTRSRPARVRFGYLKVWRLFRGRGVSRGRAVCFHEVACELFFSVRAPLPDGAHRLRGLVFAERCRDGALGGSGAGGSWFGVFGHDRILARDFRGRKAQCCDVAKPPSSCQPHWNRAGLEAAGADADPLPAAGTGQIRAVSFVSFEGMLDTAEAGVVRR